MPTHVFAVSSTFSCSLEPFAQRDLCLPAWRCVWGGYRESCFRPLRRTPQFRPSMHVFVFSVCNCCERVVKTHVAVFFMFYPQRSCFDLPSSSFGPQRKRCWKRAHVLRMPPSEISTERRGSLLQIANLLPLYRMRGCHSVVSCA